MRHELRSALPVEMTAQPGTAQPPVAPLSWAGDYFIQLAQNATTGAGFGAAVAIVWYWASQGDLPSWWGLACASTAALWFIVWTLARFHGDELGLFRALYRAGQRSQEGRIAALELELQTLYDAAVEQGAPASGEMAKRILIANATIDGARQILRVLFESGPGEISRTKMQGRNLGPQDWKRAMRLLRAAGVIDEQGQALVRDFRLSCQRVEEFHGEGLSLMRERKTFRPAWF